jgi:phage/plasmid-associated DNA primase
MTRKPDTDEKKLEFEDMLRITEPQIKWKIALKDDDRSVYRPVANTYFEKISLSACRMEIRTLWPYCLPTVVSNITNSLLEREDRLFDDTLFLECRKRLVGFQNGVFDLRTGKFRRYTQNDFVCDPLPHKIPFEVKPESEKKLLQVLGEWVDPDVAEWFCNLLAYLLFIYPNDEQIWCNFFGMGSNGKSVCLSIIESVLGEKKSIGCDLQHINRFTNQTCQGKWLVIGRDSSSYVSEVATSFIKNFSGDPRSLVEIKGGSSYDVFTTGKLIVSTNTLIQSMDRTYSWYRRLIPIPFPHIFTRDESFKLKIMRQLPDFIRVLLDRAYKYRAHHIQLTTCIPRAVQELMKETRYLNDRVSAFWETEFLKEVTDQVQGTRYEVDPEKVCRVHGLTMSQIYDYYRQWHQQEFGEIGIEPSLKTFGGAYGALLQTEAGKYFEYKRENYGRILRVKDSWISLWINSGFLTAEGLVL